MRLLKPSFKEIRSLIGKNWLALNERIVLFWRFKSVHGRFDLKEAKFLNASFNFCFFTLLKTFVCISKLIFKVSHTLKKKLKILFDLKLTFVRRTFSDDSKQVVKTRYIYDNIAFFSHNRKQTNTNSCKSSSFNNVVIYIQMISAEILSIKNCLFLSLLTTSTAHYTEIVKFADEDESLSTVDFGRKNWLIFEAEYEKRA